MRPSGTGESRAVRASRALMIAGLTAMVIGAIDPLEGSLLIVPGTGVLAVGAHVAGSRRRGLLAWSSLCVAVGVAAMWGVSAAGGLGGETGRPLWWAIVFLPYPAGFVAALVGGIRALRGTA